MKKFHFSMEMVLRYQEQRLDALRAEHAAAIAGTREQETVVDRLTQSFRSVNEEYRVRKAHGMTVADAMGYDLMLRTQEKEIQAAAKALEELRRVEDQKREAVIAAKRDKATIEKLKEKKLDAYHKQEQKNEEQMIDEFVSAARVVSRMAH